ncbi:hypothetical protein GVAV_001954 [Gurleya vavrai]
MTHKEHNAHVHLVNHDHAHDTDHHHHHHTGQYEQTYCESFSPHTHEHGRHHRCEDSDCGSDSESETILVHRH